MICISCGRFVADWKRSQPSMTLNAEGVGHGLYVCRYVMLKERNLLDSEKLRMKAEGKAMPNPTRRTKVRKGMSRIKAVMSERAISEADLQRRQQLKRFIDAL
jgi:ribosomal protein L29